MKKLTIVALDKSRQMDCFECKKSCTFGLSWDGIRIFRVVCDTCLKAYKSGIDDYLKNGVQKKGMVVEKEELIHTEEPEQYSEPTNVEDDDE